MHACIISPPANERKGNTRNCMNRTAASTRDEPRATFWNDRESSPSPLHWTRKAEIDRTTLGFIAQTREGENTTNSLTTYVKSRQVEPEAGERSSGARSSPASQPAKIFLSFFFLLSPSPGGEAWDLGVLGDFFPSTKRQCMGGDVVLVQPREPLLVASEMRCIPINHLIFFPLHAMKKDEWEDRRHHVGDREKKKFFSKGSSKKVSWLRVSYYTSSIIITFLSIFNYIYLNHNLLIHTIYIHPIQIVLLLTVTYLPKSPIPSPPFIPPACNHHHITSSILPSYPHRSSPTTNRSPRS
ncbi:hypothetical protein BU24DRAFT_69242 [Aaosphaeria arxii CBS 175.79]|uniref:Uncharacterized protein n=1 Tax=Aaosphaeria arxii CBS 175.79 TaxID=1450172 RepID=A0A6A5XAT4_9PLEO|nr:uncharacterized protein BU24DRAFT_69242 [Aaosphaeria arxii CBS 175.79]KAF2010020.1 hypothetical protein BU24DRAFT_69242 [Aaosphaeria arxii CBS 175.79]